MKPHIHGRRRALVLTPAILWACSISEAPDDQTELAVAMAIQEVAAGPAAHRVDAFDPTELRHGLSAEGVGRRTGLEVVAVDFQCDDQGKCTIDPERVDVFVRVGEVRQRGPDSMTVDVWLYDFEADPAAIVAFAIQLATDADDAWRVVASTITTEI